MTSFAIHDLQMYPLTLADVRDNAVVVARAASWKWMERISRKACVEVGSIASTCKAPRTGKEIKECAILGSTTKAIGIGRAVQAARRAHRDPIDAVLEVEARHQDLQRQDPRHRPPRHRGLPARHRDHRGPRRLPRPHLLARLPERVRGGLARRRAAGDDARPDLRARHRLGRRDRHRDAALRPAGDASSRCPRRRSCSRPRASSTWARAPSATTSTSARCSRETAHRHRRGRHQHRRRAPRGRRGRRGGEDAHHPGRDDRHHARPRRAGGAGARRARGASTP